MRPNILSQFSTDKYVARLEKKKFPVIGNSEGRLKDNTIRMMRNR